MRSFFTAIVLLFSITINAQQLRIKNGEIYDYTRGKLDKRQVRFLLADKPELAKKYYAYNKKSTGGGILLGAGAGLVMADLIIGLTTDTKYPTVITYIGAPLLAASIPILIGRRKKLEAVVEGYNRDARTTDTGFGIDQINLVINQNGAGLRLQF